jgi:hypothetical protein
MTLAAASGRSPPPCVIKRKLRLFMPRSRTSGQGRPRGVPNRSTAELKQLALAYGKPALARLALLAGLTKEPGSESEAVQLGAMRELLDRGYGRPAQTIGGDRR